METLRRLTGRETTDEPTSEAPATPAVALDYDDQQAAQLATVRREAHETQAALTQAEARWRTLAARGDDPAVDAERGTLGPHVLDLRRRAAALATEDARLDQIVRDTKALAARYAQITDDAETWLGPLLDALPTEAQLAESYARSRELDRIAADLLARSGDRGAFRRAEIDPSAALREALETALRTLERQRLLRRSAPDAGARTNSKSA